MAAVPTHPHVSGVESAAALDPPQCPVSASGLQECAAAAGRARQRPPATVVRGAYSSETDGKGTSVTSHSQVWPGRTRPLNAIDRRQSETVSVIGHGWTAGLAASSNAAAEWPGGESDSDVGKSLGVCREMHKLIPFLLLSTCLSQRSDILPRTASGQGPELRSRWCN